MKRGDLNKLVEVDYTGILGFFEFIIEIKNNIKHKDFGYYKRTKNTFNQIITIKFQLILQMFLIPY